MNIVTIISGILLNMSVEMWCKYRNYLKVNNENKTNTNTFEYIN